MGMGMPGETGYVMWENRKGKGKGVEERRGRQDGSGKGGRGWMRRRLGS